MLLSISSRGAHAVGVVELRKLLIKHVWRDAREDHVQELAVTEDVPTAGDILERVTNEENLGEMGGSVAEDAMKDVHEDVQQHAKRVSRSHKTRFNARAAPVDHPESIVEEPHSAGRLPLSMRSREPRARLHPMQLPRLAPRPRGCIRLNRGSTLLSKLASSCPLLPAARYPAFRTRRGRSNTSTCQVRRLAVAR